MKRSRCEQGFQVHIESYVVKQTRTSCRGLQNVCNVKTAVYNSQKKRHKLQNSLESLSNIIKNWVIQDKNHVYTSEL